MAFGGTIGPSPVDLGFFLNLPSNPWVKVDSELKLDSQIRLVVKSSLFQLS